MREGGREKEREGERGEESERTRERESERCDCDVAEFGIAMEQGCVLGSLEGWRDASRRLPPEGGW